MTLNNKLNEYYLVYIHNRMLHVAFTHNTAYKDRNITANFDYKNSLDVCIACILYALT